MPESHKGKECLTEEQLKKMRKESDHNGFEKANQQAAGCVICRKAWTLYWSGQKK